jgi:Glyoxalase-like domain
VPLVRPVLRIVTECSAVMRFWCSVLDYQVQGEDGGVVAIGSPIAPERSNHLGPVPPILTFEHVPEGKVVKNRVHMDLVPADRSQDEEIARLVGLGATVLSDNRPEFGWVTLSDPEGNEFDVLADRRP